MLRVLLYLNLGFFPLLLPACAASVATEVVALKAQVGQISTDVAAVKGDVSAIKTGNIKVGGGADSITAWLYAAIAAAAIFYPAVIRPIRKYISESKT